MGECVTGDAVVAGFRVFAFFAAFGAAQDIQGLSPARRFEWWVFAHECEDFCEQVFGDCDVGHRRLLLSAEEFICKACYPAFASVALVFNRKG